MTRPPLVEIAPAKINLALHVRGRRPDGRHELETVFAFCTDGDKLTALPADGLSLTITGPFAAMLDDGPANLVHRAATALAAEARVGKGVQLTLDKQLPVASGIGGGSADAAAALRLLTRLWGADPAHAAKIAPELGSDVPACLLSMTARGTGAGDALELVDAGVAGTPVLLVNPLLPLGTGAVFGRWDGVDRGPLGDWRQGRNDLEAPARSLVPAIGDVLDWLGKQEGVELARMSGSGATCFALFASEEARDAAAAACPDRWWHLASFLR
ncbi:4-(cytidine 5'-diphospho)-2-C-methyl-D-erythritol kinase [Sphingomonas astaxanthinifaciens]|uniref:4-diphosphocytidyl-2-C-methyl-D-erythritol kinase n=1 Tax=Sphingomonas astaxanthinifaciens DSM 22298 TaxID=1123267 RepID=A0ABQ5ZCD0_9SPHN|nr:4-(cytidine 5'-diphospho)-2-C-methyl-D-erythritol kinase [Sphingomonas astaxanthinifaciens]GLR48444.1 4-diphosphocytidyl-2-C-methyl-D-erythritol kinase [Sphingomonas astaxanthinifaciens DSM 22298]